MLQHRLLHVIMAVYLAIWSPIACCCAVKSALGAATGVEIGCCSSPTVSHVGDSQAEVEPVHSCCRPAAVPASAPEPADEPAVPSDNCNCQNKLVKIAPSEGAAKVSVPTFVHELPAVLSATVTVVPVSEQAARFEFTIRGAHGPPRASLFAQRCLLTI